MKNHFKINLCLRNKPNLKHDNSVSKPTEHMSLVDIESFLKTLDGHKHIILEALLACLHKVVVCTLSLRRGCPFDRHHSQLTPDWIERVKSSKLLDAHLMLLILVMEFSGETMSVQDFYTVRNYFVRIVPCLIHVYFGHFEFVLLGYWLPFLSLRYLAWNLAWNWVRG